MRNLEYSESKTVVLLVGRRIKEDDISTEPQRNGIPTVKDGVSCRKRCGRSFRDDICIPTRC